MTNHRKVSSEGFCSYIKLNGEWSVSGLHALTDLKRLSAYRRHLQTLEHTIGLLNVNASLTNQEKDFLDSVVTDE